MTNSSQTIEEIDERIATAQENLRQLVEQAAGFSGAADEELASERISTQEAELDRLKQLRDTLGKA
jgi:hypothetical protein